jgi:SAM-dependent methyltransferase
VTCLEHALHVTIGDLVFDDGSPSVSAESRWDAETIYTLEFIAEKIAVSPSWLVLDYGCGTGRISKGMIDNFGCNVVGVDASPTMCDVATSFVQSDAFRLEPFPLDLSCAFDFGVCFWVLQHSGSSCSDIDRIYRALKPSARLLVFNENRRSVPTIEFGFANDGIDIQRQLSKRFGAPIGFGKLDPTRVAPAFSERTFWAVYKKSLSS